jgi:hypothetical protein
VVLFGCKTLFQNDDPSVSFSIWETNPTFVTCYDPGDTSWVLVAQDTCLHATAFAHLSRVGVQTSRQCGAYSNFLLRSPGKLHN